MSTNMDGDGLMQDAAARLHEAAAAKKCWACGCLHGALETIERAVPIAERSAVLDAALCAARTPLTPIRYDCLGCDVCFPSLALNAIHASRGEPTAAAACPTERVESRAGWPPLPGAYTVLRYRAPVAICTLTDDALVATIARLADPGVAIVGTLQTENLGIERLITNVLANPNIRFLVIAGADSRQAIGHLPGQSLVALTRNGIEASRRIVGARGKRPVLRNPTHEAVEHFRGTVEAVDLIGATDLDRVMTAVRACAARQLGPAPPFVSDTLLTLTTGHLPFRMVPDPAGYFVIYVDRARHRLSLEHYRNDGLLDTIIEGGTAAEVYTPAIERSLLSRLDHAAYLGRELARAEHALRIDEPYIQDGAPESITTVVVSPASQSSCCGASARDHETCPSETAGSTTVVTTSPSCRLFDRVET
jgi:tetrahydromethanopterin S-methyltransferase subunit A